MSISRSASTSVRSSLSALLGGAGGLFDGDGPVHRATLRVDDDAAVPGGAAILTAGGHADALIKLSAVDDHYTVCIKIPDAYGPGKDQDFLLASSADGIPFHHAVLPADSVDSRLYSSLWLYLAGIEPVAFGLRAEESSRADGLTAGDRFRFLISSAIGRFRPIGTVTVADRLGDAGTRFSGRNSGGGLRALPPALFYRG